MTKSLFTGLIGLTLAALPTVAFADDDSLAIHGFGAVSFKNDYLTPRGLLVTNKGVTTQILDGLVFDVYHDPSQTISDFAITVGTWNDIDSTHPPSKVGGWNEFDWFVGGTFTIADNFQLGAQYVAFISPPGNFNDEQNIEFSLSYDDKLSPISINPYIKLFYAVSGDSTVVTGAKGGTFDVEIGAAPSFTLAPVTFSFPTWITVGPADYWGGKDNVGVFSTGVSAKLPLTFMPKKLGGWSVNAGIQYYNMLNSQLTKASAILGTGGVKDELVYSVGFGFGF